MSSSQQLRQLIANRLLQWEGVESCCLEHIGLSRTQSPTTSTGSAGTNSGEEYQIPRALTPLPPLLAENWFYRFYFHYFVTHVAPMLVAEHWDQNPFVVLLPQSQWNFSSSFSADLVYFIILI